MRVRSLAVLSLLACGAAIVPLVPAHAAGASYDARFSVVVNATLAGTSAVATASTDAQHSQWVAAEMQATRAANSYLKAQANLKGLTAPAGYGAAQSMLAQGVGMYVSAAIALQHGIAAKNGRAIVNALSKINNATTIVVKAAGAYATRASSAGQLAAAAAAYASGVQGAMSNVVAGAALLKAIGTDVKGKNYSAAKTAATTALADFKSAQTQLASLKAPNGLGNAQSLFNRAVGNYVSGMNTVLSGIAAKQPKTVTSGMNTINAGSTLLQQGITALG
jgi:hypothetical protein